MSDVTYKIRVNRPCRLFIDDEEVMILEESKLAKINLSEGEYLRKVVAIDNSAIFDEAIIVLSGASKLEDIVLDTTDLNKVRNMAFPEDGLEVDGILYQVNEDGKNLSVIQCTNRTCDEIEIPSYIAFAHNSYCVTSIGRYAFNGCSSLTIVVIPNSIKSIGDGAFSCCSSLISVTIPNSVTSIGDDVFEGCSSLSSITIGSNVKSIGENAFRDCSSLTSVHIIDIASWCNIDFGDYIANPLFYARNLFQNGELIKDLVIPNSVTSIRKFVFRGCSSLTSIIIPNSVTRIEEEAFEYCSSLSSITIGSNVKSIERGAFNDCSSLTSVHITDIAAWCNIGYGGYGYTNPLSYAHNLYLNGELIKDLVIPNSVTRIREFVFYGCSSLTSIIIPSSVTSIGDSAFYACSSLTSVMWGAKNCNSYNFGAQVTSFEFGNEVEVIPDFLCKEMEKLTSITIPNSVNEIGTGAFAVCSSLTSVIIGESVRRIGDYAFNCCKVLTSVKLPNSVVSIGNRTFRYCSSLTSILIPSSVTRIGDSAFEECYSLNSVFIDDLVAWCNVDFGDHNANPLSYAHNLYLNGELIKDLVIPNCVTRIREFVFYGCSSLTSIIIPSSVTRIGENAFTCCKALNSVHITDIASWCNIDFSVNTANPLSLAHNLYLNGELIKDLVIPNCVTSIGKFVFCGCSSITTVSIPNSVTWIAYGAFMRCDALTSVTLPNSVRSIGNKTFRYCSSLISVTIGDSVTEIGCGAFENCSSLASVTIGNSVTEIRCGAFENCSSLSSITIPCSVTSIEYYAFKGCSCLTSVTMYLDIKRVDKNVFDGCSRDLKIYNRNHEFIKIDEINSVEDNNYYDGFDYSDLERDAAYAMGYGEEYDRQAMRDDPDHGWFS